MFGGLGRNRTADTRIFNFLNTYAASFSTDLDVPRVMADMRKWPLRPPQETNSERQFVPIQGLKRTPFPNTKPEVFRPLQDFFVSR